MNIKPILSAILERTKNPRFWFRLVGATFLTLMIFYVIFMFIDPSVIIKTLKQVSPLVVLLSFVLYLCSTFIRAVRFHVLHPIIPIRTFFTITAIHAMFSNVMPARSGELAFPILLKRVDGSSFIMGLSILFIVRIFDLIAVFIFFFVALTMTYSYLDSRLHVVMLSVSFVFIIMMSTVFSILVFGKKALVVARRMLFFDGLRHNKVTIWIFSNLELLFEGFRVIRKTHALWRIMFFSVLLWLSNYAAVILLVRSMGLGLSMWVIILGFTFSMLFSILPINGLGSFGTLEAAWTLIFLSFGVTKEVSFATGFGFHIISVSYLSILGIIGIICFVFLPKQKRRENSSATKN